MRKKILLAILLPVTVLVIAALSLTVFRSFELNLERARDSVLREENIIARSVRAELGDGTPSWSDTLRAAQGLEQYEVSGLRTAILYHGTPLAGKDVPEEIRASGLLDTRGRATYLSAAEKTMYVARAMTDSVMLLTASDLSPVYESRNEEQRSAALLCAAGLALALILSLILSGTLTRPLKQLAKAADELRRGRFSVPLPEPGADETGRLTTAFAAMSEAVAEREKSLQEQAKQKQDLLDALAHEMRTPLTAIVGAADLIPLKPESAPEMARMIRSEATRLAALDENLMTLTRMNADAPEFTVFSARACVREATDCFPDTVTEGGDAGWTGDRELILLLIRNLVANAWRSGTAEPVRVRILPDGFDVSDRGRGMTEEEAARAFDAFWKADPARTRKNGGAGLGLTLCARIAELHRAGLTLDSRPGEGTTVSFRFTDPLQACEDPET